MVRFVIALGIVALGWIIWRNVSQARFRAEQRKAWDEPLREGHVAVLTAERRHWVWFSALAAATAIVGYMLWERVHAGTLLSDTPLHVIVFAAMAAVALWRYVQLSERVAVTWDRITSSNMLGVRYDLPLSEVTAVDENDRTALIAFADGRVLELSPWLEGRFWLARELRARMEAND